MSHFTGYGAYQLFLALRTHFSSNRYDFFRMHGKLRATKESYLKRNDKWFFDRIAKEYTAEELRDFYLANLLQDRIYITELLDDAAKSAYTNYQRQRQGLSYHYSNELGRLFDKGLRDPFIVHNDTYPTIVLLFLRRTISLETMVILDDQLGFTKKFDKHYADDVLWPKISKQISKYRPFLKYDRAKMNDILRGIMNEQREATETIPTEEQTY